MSSLLWVSTQWDDGAQHSAVLHLSSLNVSSVFQFQTRCSSSSFIYHHFDTSQAVISLRLSGKTQPYSLSAGLKAFGLDVLSQ